MLSLLSHPLQLSLVHKIRKNLLSCKTDIKLDTLSPCHDKKRGREGQENGMLLRKKIYLNLT